MTLSLYRATGPVEDSSDLNLWYSLVPSGHRALSSGMPEVIRLTRLDIVGSLADSVLSLSHVMACLSMEWLFSVPLVEDVGSSMTVMVREDREDIASPVMVSSAS